MTRVTMAKKARKLRNSTRRANTKKATAPKESTVFLRRFLFQTVQTILQLYIGWIKVSKVDTWMS